MIEKYEITIDRHKYITVKEMKEYIQESIDMWRKGGNPGTPFFRNDLKLKVKRIKNEKLQH